MCGPDPSIGGLLAYLLVSGRAPDRQRVRLSVEDPLVEGQHVGVVLKQQVKVLEGLSKEEGLHLVGKTRRDLRANPDMMRLMTAQSQSAAHRGPS